MEGTPLSQRRDYILPFIGGQSSPPSLPHRPHPVGSSVIFSQSESLLPPIHAPPSNKKHSVLPLESFAYSSNTNPLSQSDRSLPLSVLAKLCLKPTSWKEPYPIAWGEAMLVSSNVLRLRCWFRMTLTVNRFELRNRNRSTIPIILCTLVALQKLDTNVKILAYEDF